MFIFCSFLSPVRRDRGRHSSVVAFGRRPASTAVSVSLSRLRVRPSFNARRTGVQDRAAVLIRSMAVGRPTFEPVRHDDIVSQYLIPAMPDC